MRFFCTQPDIVEDARNVRYQTKSKPQPTIPKHRVGTLRSTGQAPAVVPLPDTNTTVNRSRTHLAHNVLSGGKKFFHTHSHTSNSIEQRKLSIGAPTLITAPSSVTSASVNILGVGNTNMVSVPALSVPEPVPKPTQKPKSYDGAGRISMENKALTDTEGLGGRRKSRRLSTTPFVAALKFGSGNEEGFVSGNESGKDSKAKRRISKFAIGAPEGFRHEAHMGLGETFGAVVPPQDRETWSVETWRAEIERTRKHSSAPTMARPKGPRPTSIEPPARRRGSIDGTAPRWSTDRERAEVTRWAPEKEKEASRWPNERERDGAVSDYPIGRALTTPNRSSTNASSREARHSRSRSGSQTQTGSPTRDGHQTARSTTIGQSGLQGFVQGHVPGKESITSLASTPTTVTTLSSNAIITPTTTTTSLSRSLSEKPYYNHHGHHQSNQLLGDGIVTYGKGLTNSSLQRASSANATVGTSQPPNLPPSSSTSTATFTSQTTSSTTTRKPIPHQRRKPVPQHLPITAEVSPFPSVLIPKTDDTTSSPSPTFPFEMNPAVQRAFQDANASNGAWEERMKSWRDGSSNNNVQKQLVPLLGSPTDGAHYVTKSTKARWDDTMAEIANALKDPDLTPTPA